MDNLPIDFLDKEAFELLKRKCLDQEVLSEDTLNMIKDLYDIPGRVTLKCTEPPPHVHDYACLEFDHPGIAVVFRLILEAQYGQIKREQRKS